MKNNISPQIHFSQFEPDFACFLRVIKAKAYSGLIEQYVQLFNKVKSLLIPKSLFYETVIEENHEWGVTIEGKKIKSRLLAAKLKADQRVILYIATCGNEVENISMSDYDHYLAPFWVDTLKNFALNQAVVELKERVGQLIGYDEIYSINPGTKNPDLWDISGQKGLFELIGKANQQIGVILTESCLMIPNKTVSGFYFHSDNEYSNCLYCDKENCARRNMEQCRFELI